MTDFDRAFPEQDAYEIEADGVRRLVLDAEQEEELEAHGADGRQMVVQPPVGTVGGPQPPPGDDVTTSETRSIHAGGGPGDPTRMPGLPDALEHGEGGTGGIHAGTDEGIGASPNPK